MFDFVEELQSDANIKQAAVELAKGIQEKDEPNEGEETVRH